MPDACEATVIPYDPGIGGEGEGHRHISRDEVRGRAWLPWKSNGCEHGLRRHLVGIDGVIQETGDRDHQAATRKKPRVISSRQYEGRC